MRRIAGYILWSVLLMALNACDVHEWFEIKMTTTCHLRLDYATGMTVWNCKYDGEEVIEQNYGNTYDNHLDEGTIRYVIRAYPATRGQATQQEFTFYKDISEGYNHEVTLDILPGEYNLVVWSDLMPATDSTGYYNADNFAYVRLSGAHAGNTDYRDAFRGTAKLNLVPDSILAGRNADTLTITMQRPLAKFELVANDVQHFIREEHTRAMAAGNVAPVIDIEDYTVQFHYIGFMPNAYNIYSDKPTDSATGIMFESPMKKLSEHEATMGFDYLFLREGTSQTTIQVAICDKQGEQLTISKTISIPIERDYHTKVVGSFLTLESSGGAVINPGYNGDHNLVFP